MAPKKKRKRSPAKAGGSRAHPKNIHAAERTKEIFELRKAGWRYSQIGEKFGITKQRVYKIIHTLLEQMIYEPAEEYRNLQLQRKEKLLAAWWQWALGGEKTIEAKGVATTVLIPPSKDAADICRNLLIDIEKLVGLAPKKVEYSGPGGKPLEMPLAITGQDELREILEILRNGKPQQVMVGQDRQLAKQLGGEAEVDQEGDNGRTDKSGVDRS